MRTTGRRLAMCAALALVLIGFMVTGPALAGSPLDLVSDDGSVIPAAAVEAMATGEGAGSQPFRGTGVMTEEMRQAAALGFVPTREEIAGLPPVSAGVGIESVLGADTRTRLYTSPASTAYPASATALITFTGGYCTGWFYGPKVVATAGHCVHSGGTSGAWKTNVKVYPAYNAGAAPYGSYPSIGLYSVSGWTDDPGSGNELYDFGVIRIGTDAGTTVGWYGLLSYSSATSYVGLPSIVMGYPDDKTPKKSMWESADKVWRTLSPPARQVFYRNDTYAGQSGAAIWYDRPTGSTYCTGVCAYGIHAYGLHGSSPHKVYNHGVGLVTDVYNRLIQVRNLN
jgi:glutamyl endopeptidase